MVEVRELTNPEDAVHVMPLLREFFKQTRQAKFVEMDDDAVLALVAQLVSNPAAAVFAAVDEGEVVGVTGGLLYPLWFSPTHTTGQEMFWYVGQEHRRSKAGKKLFNALEEWAKAAGADSFAMVALSHLHENRIGKMYESKGYTPMERSYIKEF